MDNIIRVSLELENMGRSISPFSNVVIHQGLDTHHYFELTCPMRVFEDENTVMIQRAKEAIGDILKIGITRASEQEGTARIFFKGIVTDVSLAKYEGIGGDLIIRGYSPTILLDSIADFATYADTTIVNIVRSILSEIPVNIMQNEVSVETDEAVTHLIQYDETSFSLINDISKRIGLWSYYDGTKYYFGDKPNTPEINLTYGTDCSNLDFDLKVVPVNFKFKAYPYANQSADNIEFVESDSLNQTVNGLDNYGTYLMDRSPNIFNKKVTWFFNSRAVQQSILNDMVKERKSSAASRFVTVRGRASNPDIRLGSVINVEEQRGSSRESMGKYRIISLVHEMGGAGAYTCSFEAIPFQLQSPPRPMTDTSKKLPLLNAIVVDNNDPDKLGRVKVRFMWMPSNQSSAWIRVKQVAASKDAGFFFLPDIDDEVIVDHIQSRVPVIIGALYRSHREPMNKYTEFSHSDGNVNRFKGYFNKTGLEMTFNEKTSNTNGGALFLGDFDKQVALRIFQDRREGTTTIYAGESVIELTKQDGIKIHSNKPIKIESQQSAPYRDWETMRHHWY